MTTKRKPYVREMKPTWWKELGFYKFYMLREGTAIPQVWFSIVLIVGLFNPQGFIGFLQNPIVLLLNIVTLAATLLHTKTWFDLAPKAADIIVKDKKVPAETLVKGLWVIMALATVIILAIALI
jgi:fumarate reductase subunit C